MKGPTLFGHNRYTAPMITKSSLYQNTAFLRLCLIGMGLYFFMWIILLFMSYLGWRSGVGPLPDGWISYQVEQGIIGAILALGHVIPIARKQKFWGPLLGVLATILVHSFIYAFFNFKRDAHAMNETYSLTSLFFMSIATVGWVHAFTALGLYYTRRVEAHSADLTRAAKLEADLHRSQLNHLQASLNPHFLFNALNTVSALIVLEENKKADEATIILGDLLRRSLALNDEPMIELKEEIEISKLYLDMESLRFADRVNIQWDIDDACLAYKVPKFALQPLLENVFKHSVRHSAKTVHLIIKAEPHLPSHFTLSLWNSLPERTPEQDNLRIHTGLDNVNQRLALVFRDPVHFNAGPHLREGISGFLVSARLPTHQGVT
ncbi:sensor histidine kinase [Woodsholea maritima]|uniref:sensor histidine kinase n=1 Tax=Woodsholea maritima TaxID=240237 RepID=UPI000A0108BA|nr:histidine kinase [Woodsholea maritima]